MLSVSNIQPSVPDNKALVSVISACNVQPFSTTLVVQPTSSAAAAAGVTFDTPTQATITNVAQAFPTTNIKLQIIIKRLDAPSISNKGSCVVSSLVPIAHISEVIFIPT